MADSVQLVLVIHNHQPVGNFDDVIDAACDNAYLPFLQMLDRYPRIRIGLHTSGCLWEWLEAHRPDYGQLMAQLHARGQIELLGGGMYEPILPVLPGRDAVWQLKRMNRFLSERFGAAPSGMWCPERVWEPQLPAVIAAAGLEYTLLDDFHFGGSVDPALIATDYFITEHAGALTALLPISKKLRYTIPFQPVDDTIDYLQSIRRASTATPLVVFGDDGEKFGVWPDTHEWVYERGWLERFFSGLDANLDWIDLLTPAEMINRRRPAAKVFVPCMSYAEMGEWTRVDPAAGKTDPPGFWRNYLYKYPEVNAMYRRMLGVSDMLERARNADLPEHVLADVADDIGRAQCNCAYWHGVFGGLYLNYLRQAIYYHAIHAERTLLETRPSLAENALEITDHDGLGWDQYVLRDQHLTVVADPGRGLCLSRIDCRPSLFCWTNVLTRRHEAYHSKIMAAEDEDTAEHASIHDRVILKEPGLERKLVVDDHQRVSFTTCFSNLKTAAQLMAVPGPDEQPPQDSYRDYYLPLTEIITEGNEVAGTIDYGEFRLRKSLRLERGHLVMHLAHNGGTLPADAGRFMVEFNLTVLTDNATDRYLEINGHRHTIADPGDWTGATRVQLVDRWQQQRLRLDSAQLRHLHYYPIHTVSSSEAGFESTYQGSCLLLDFDPQALAAGIEITLEITGIDDPGISKGEL